MLSADVKPMLNDLVYAVLCQYIFFLYMFILLSLWPFQFQTWQAGITVMHKSILKKNCFICKTIKNF
jgi:hypothetical protein